MSFDRFLNEINRGFTKNQRNGVVFFTAPSFDKLGFVRHGVTSRIGGVSEPPYDSLNLSFKRTPDTEVIRKNFEIASNAMGFSFESLVMCHYVHGNNVEVVNAEHHGAGITRENELPFCDGVITVSPDTACVSLHSDCGIIMFADRRGRAVGTCHSGWKGTDLETVVSVIRKMESIGIDRSDILFALGPAISGRNYEIKEDVESHFRERFPESLSYRYGKIYLDINTALLKQMYNEGIPAANVTCADMCTYENREYLYSYRRDGKNAGAMGAFIGFSK
ncbi:MAG: laccase domain-containing protein [Clostridia bacterium]|nr:laccase domain-containing protein [Clostridia bacterium]